MSYPLPNAWELARRRLELLEACHDPTTIRHAEALGVSPGWRCLEAGAGSGSFARWLAARTDSVVAADIDVRLLEQLDEPNLEVRQMDLVTDDLPAAAFDFVHCRMVLMHMPERDDVLARLATAVRPGGVLLVEEGVIHPILSIATGAYLEAWQAFHDTMRELGVDPHWAVDLPQRLDALGLLGVGAEFDGELFRGGSEPAEFWSLSWLQVRDRIGRPEVVDRGREVLADTSRWFHGSGTIVAWGRAPGG